MANKKIKVILQENVPDLGSKYDVEEVAMGYFRNYLLPNGLAEPATDERLEKLEEKKKRWQQQKEQRIEELKEAADNIESEKLEFTVKTGEEGQVYSSVSSADIKERLQEKDLVEKVSVNLGNPLRELGEHEIELNLGEGVKAVANIEIKPEDRSMPEEEEETEKEE